MIRHTCRCRCTWVDVGSISFFTCSAIVCVCVHVCVFVDLTDLSSFDRAKFWVNELKQTEEVRDIGLVWSGNWR